MTVRKYEFVTDDTIAINGVTLTRIRALIDIPGICKAGDLGGYLQSEANLSHEGNCWVLDNARVYENAQISGNARVSGNSQVFGESLIYGNAQVFGNARVFGNSRLYGTVHVSGNSLVGGDADISQPHHVMWFSNVGTENDTLTVFKSKDGVQVTRGCFLGTPEEFSKASQEQHDEAIQEEY